MRAAVIEYRRNFPAPYDSVQSGLAAPRAPGPEGSGWYLVALLTCAPESGAHSRASRSRTREDEECRRTLISYSTTDYRNQRTFAHGRTRDNHQHLGLLIGFRVENGVPTWRARRPWTSKSSATGSRVSARLGRISTTEQLSSKSQTHAVTPQGTVWIDPPARIAGGRCPNDAWDVQLSVCAYVLFTAS